MSHRELFTRQLLSQLKSEGYTHIQLRGPEKKADENKIPGINLDDFILIPRKPGFILFEETDLRIEPINSTDISDMLDVEFGINFWIELPD